MRWVAVPVALPPASNHILQLVMINSIFYIFIVCNITEDKQGEGWPTRQG